MAHVGEQMVLNNDIFSPKIHSKPSLADLLTVETSVSIFYSYARELELSSSLTDENSKLTILAPTNRAVMSSARKPHQSPEMTDEGVHISDEEYDRISKENIQKWISCHIIPNSPIDLDSPEAYPTLLDGKLVTFKPISKNDGKGSTWNRVTLDGGIKILNMREASNGVLYIIDGSIVPT
ncbi:hypothetical protein APHAL10511_005097 [Amanita phalloides]|nr:hypothetical protein APHAL10511_005097 [Amanita phalloides]